MQIGAGTLNGTNASDLLHGGSSADTLKGNGGIDLIYGANGNDILEGGSGNDFLLGGIGNDVIRAGSGNDQVKGGSGYDQFVFNLNEAGSNTIHDFEANKDVIVIDELVDNSSQMTAQTILSNAVSDGSQVTLFISNDLSINLVGIDISDLSSANFII